MRKVLDLMDAQSADVVLDVGCGPGVQLIHLSRRIKAGFGIDPAEGMIAQAEQSAAECPNVRFYVGTAEALPQELNGAGIHKIFSNYALHHLPDAAKSGCIRNFGSLLPEGGAVVLGDLMFSDDPAKHEALFDFVGYGPGCDTPSRLPALEGMFMEAGLLFQTHVLNPLAAVIVGRKA